jgi:hypothetical protein
VLCALERASAGGSGEVWDGDGRERGCGGHHATSAA